MSNLLKRLVGIVYVEQKGDVIQIGGMASQNLARDIQSTWSTSKIHGHLFTDFGRRALEFPLFYALEVHFMLQQLLKNRRNWTSRNAILAAIKGLEENTWLQALKEDPSHLKVLDRSKLSLFHKTPLDHQTRFFERYEIGRGQLGLRGYLLSAAPGAGKTLTNLMVAEMVHSDYVVIVSPNNAVYRVWDAALKNEYKVAQESWIAGEGKPYKNQRFLISHYEGLQKLLEEVKRLRGKITVVLDECHNFNEISSLRTQLFIRLCESTQSENIIWASGTPIKALGGESIPLLKTIDPLFHSKVEESFKKIFGISARRALDILRNRMGFISFRVEKSEFRDEKPSSSELKVKIPNGQYYTVDAVRQRMMDFINERMEYYKKNYKTYEDVYLGILKVFEANLKTSEQKNEFREYQRQVAIVKKNPDPRYTGDQMKFCNHYEKNNIMPTLSNEDKKKFKSAKSVIKYVQLKVMGEALGGVLGRARTQLHVDMLAHIKFEDIMHQAEKKTVIFTSYVEVVKELDRLLKARGMKPMLVFGETNKNLTENVGAFETDAEVDPLVATFMSLSTAVPLVMADLAILLNSPFRSHEMVQAKARLDRLGQDTPVKFVHVFLDTGDDLNISTRSKDILEWSRSQVAAILGTDYTDEVKEVYAGYVASLESLESPQAVQDFERALSEILD